MIARTLGLITLLALTACGQAEPGQAPDATTTTASAPPPDLPAQEPASAPAEAPIEGPDAARSGIEARYTPHYRRCLETGDAARGVTTAMAECIAAELKLQDGALNAEYQHLMRAMPASEFEAVRQAQRQWLKDRDAKCRAAASSGGTIDRLNGPACLLDETVGRTIALEKIGAEGAL